MITTEELFLILMKRNSNRWKVNGYERAVGFYSAYQDYVECYFVDPNRLAAGTQFARIHKEGIAKLIKVKELARVVAVDGSITMRSDWSNW